MVIKRARSACLFLEGETERSDVCLFRTLNSRNDRTPKCTNVFLLEFGMKIFYLCWGFFYWTSFISREILEITLQEQYFEIS